MREIEECYDNEDLVNISVLNEPELLSNLKMRFVKEKIFTYVGHTLIIINPYKEIAQLFNEEVTLTYKQVALKN